MRLVNKYYLMSGQSVRREGQTGSLSSSSTQSKRREMGFCQKLRSCNKVMNNHAYLWAGRLFFFFFFYIYTTRPRYFWTQLSTLPSGLRKFEGQIHPHFWGGEVELWRHESAFLWSYGTNSPRVRFPAFQPRKTFFRPLASFTGLFWYSCHLPNIPKGPTWLWLWFQVGQQLVMWNGDLLQKGQENSRTGVSAAQVNVLCWREADSHQTSLLSLMCGSPQVTNRKDLPPSDQIVIWGTG